MSKRSGAKKRRARLSRTEPPPKPPPKFGSRVQAVSAAAPVAQARWTQLQIDALFEQTVRSLLQVPNNEPEDLRALREIDERLDEPLLDRSTKWMDLGPRSGLSDAQRMLRWLRLNPGGVDDVLKRALASRPSPIPRPNLSRQQVKTSQKRRAIEAAKHDARAEGRALSFTVREDARMLSR